MAGKGGGGWKVAYADFVTAMMAFFMVMWLVGQSPKMKEAVAEHFQHDPMDELFGDGQELDPRDGGKGGGFRRVGKQNKKTEATDAASNGPGSPTEKKSRILVVHGGERTGVATMVTFAPGSTELTPEAKQGLHDLLPRIVGKPHKIEVRGHAFERTRPDDSAESIWSLAFARGLAVQKYLTENEIPAERIRISAAGRYEPFTLDEDRERQAKNERVEVYMLSEFVEDLQGSKAERDKRYQQEEAAANYSSKPVEVAPATNKAKYAAKSAADEQH